jgi:hypothetical protein
MRTIGSGRLFKANQWSSTSNPAPPEPRLPRDPPPRTRCAGEVSVAARLEGYYEFAAVDEMGAGEAGGMCRGGRDRGDHSAALLRLQGPPRGLRRIGEREVDWTDTADCDDRRFILAVDHAVVIRRSGHAMHEAAGRRRHARSGVEISAAVDPPTPRDNDDAEPVARISMRRAHVSRMPADKDIVEAWRSAVPG